MTLSTPADVSGFCRRRSPASNHRSDGFSLVEVTLAMGIAAFALLVIFSMLPTGMATTQATSRQIAETEIFNRIGSELASTPLYVDPIKRGSNDSLDIYAQPSTTGPTAFSLGRFPAYFDIEGNELKSTAKNAVFIVQCSVETYDSKTNKDVWKPLADYGLGEIRWATVRIGFHKNPGSSDNPSPSATPDSQVTKRTFVLSNRGT